MRIYIVQHGRALEKAVDPDRPLTSEGRDEIVRVSTQLQRLAVQVSSVYHSGKTRARETAQIMADYVSEGRLCVQSGMGPNEDVTILASCLEDKAMYIGHLPHLSKWVSYLVTGDMDRCVINMVNGGVVCLNEDHDGFQIDWYLRPSQLL